MWAHGRQAAWVLGRRMHGGGGGNDHLRSSALQPQLHTQLIQPSLPPGVRGPGTKYRGRNALDTPQHWAVGGRARSCICGDSAAGHGWLAQAPPTSLPWSRYQRAGVGPRCTWTCSLVQCTDGVSAHISEQKSSSEASHPLLPLPCPFERGAGLKSGCAAEVIGWALTLCLPSTCLVWIMPFELNMVPPGSDLKANTVLVTD